MAGSAVRPHCSPLRSPRLSKSLYPTPLSDRLQATGGQPDNGPFACAGSNMDGQLGVGVSGNVTELQPLVRVARIMSPSSMLSSPRRPTTFHSAACARTLPWL